MKRRGYQEVQQSMSPMGRAKHPEERSREVFAQVERFIASRPELARIEPGCPHLRLAVLYCRSRKLPASQILKVREQMIADANHREAVR